MIEARQGRAARALGRAGMGDPTHQSVAWARAWVALIVVAGGSLAHGAVSVTTAAYAGPGPGLPGVAAFASAPLIDDRGHVTFNVGFTNATQETRAGLYS